MARKSFLATVVGIAAFAVPNAFADKGGIPHEGSNGQGRPAAQQQTAATAPHGKALAKGHSKSHSNAKANAHAKSHSNAKANAHANSHSNAGAAKPSNQTPSAPPASNTHAKAGKTTICHATGSATNPYVTITISNNALPAHSRHQDGRDIIPAPAGGCPTGQQTETSQSPTPEKQQTPAPTTQQQTAATPPAGQVLGETVSGSSPSQSGPTSTPAGSVLGATTSGGSPSASGSPAATATRAASSSSLPFTGTDAIIVAILGLAALLLGVTARRAAAHRS
jgi:hypothetical protein